MRCVHVVMVIEYGDMCGDVCACCHMQIRSTWLFAHLGQAARTAEEKDECVMMMMIIST